MAYTRRMFLAASAAALGAVALGGRAQAAEVKMTRNLSCGRIGVGATQEEALDLAVRFGFQSIDPDPGFLASLDDEALAAFRAKMADANIVWAAGGVGVDFRDSEAAFADGMKALPAQCAALQRAGVTRTGTWLMFGHEFMTYRQYGKLMADRLRAIGEVCGEHGLRFGLEYVGTWSAWSSVRYPWVHTMAETKELIGDIGLSNVGLILDSWHWYHAKEGFEDIMTLKNADIVAVDLNDAPAGLEPKEMADTVRELPCATGVIDLRAFMKALAALGYDGPVRAEPFKAELGTLPKEEAVQRTAKAMEAAWALI